MKNPFAKNNNKKMKQLIAQRRLEEIGEAGALKREAAYVEKLNGAVREAVLMATPQVMKFMAEIPQVKADPWNKNDPATIDEEFNTRARIIARGASNHIEQMDIYPPNVLRIDSDAISNMVRARVSGICLDQTWWEASEAGTLKSTDIEGAMLNGLTEEIAQTRQINHKRTSGWSGF